MRCSRRTTLVSTALCSVLALAAGCTPGGGSGVCSVDPSAPGCATQSPNPPITSPDAGGGNPATDAGSAGKSGADAGNSNTGSTDAGNNTGSVDAGNNNTGSADAGNNTGSADAGAAHSGSDAGSGGSVDAGSSSGEADAGSASDAGSAGGTSADAGTALAADPMLLPMATTAQAPLIAAYDALNVPALAAGKTYADPTTGVKIYKLTADNFPSTSASFNHDYSEGGDEVSLPYTGDGKTRAVLVRDAGSSYWLIDFTPGTGVSNARELSGAVAPDMDIAFSFSNNPATPYYAYVSTGTAIERIDIRTLTLAPGGNWPVTGETAGTWLQQSASDGMFVWMRGATGGVVVVYQPATGLKQVYTNSEINEPRIDRGGRYVAMNYNSPSNSVGVWDWNTGAVGWTTPGDPGIPFGHCASLQGRWMCVDVNLTFPGEYSVFLSATANSEYLMSGAANGTLVHGSGNWVQYPADPDAQWALFDSYDYIQPVPTSVAWLAPGGMVFVDANGNRRLLGHEYNTSTDYTLQGYSKPSSDGRYVLFTSNMDGSARSDLFLAEMPAQ